MFQKSLKKGEKLYSFIEKIKLMGLLMEKDDRLSWDNLILRKRLRYEDGTYLLKEDKVEDKENHRKIRTDFHRDYDRLIFSQAFRRLGGKTQVHPLIDNDIIHTRLTHSLETASVGRSLGYIAGKKIEEQLNNECKFSVDDIAVIVQAACLAHDLGNPPFGHAGEDVISNWFKEYFENNNDIDLEENEKIELSTFDGNAQGFRLITKFENNLLKGGLNLTVTTLATCVKYPKFASKENCKKFSFFKSEKDIAKLVFTELGLVTNPDHYIRHPLSFLVEAADDICYSMIDIIDAIELKILSLNSPDLKNIFSYLNLDNHYNKILSDGSQNDTRKASKLVALAINEITKVAGNTFNNKIDIFSKPCNKIKDLISIIDDDNIKNAVITAKEISAKQVFTEQNKIKLEIAAYEVLGNILKNLVEAVVELDKQNNEKSKLSYKYQKVLNLMKSYAPKEADYTIYEKLRKVVDYVSGMTDSFAVNLSQQLTGVSHMAKRL